jgi:hypothetical protein
VLNSLTIHEEVEAHYQVISGVNECLPTISRHCLYFPVCLRFPEWVLDKVQEEEIA